MRLCRSRSIVLACLCLTGCAISRDLSRDEAGKTLNSFSDFFVAETAQLAEPAKSTRAGAREGLWTEHGWGDLTLTDYGHQFFSKVVLGIPGYVVRFQHPLKRVVTSVTGIAGSGNPDERRASFDWRYEQADDVVARYIGYRADTAFHGSATFRRFDDGWRVERIELDEAERPTFAGVPQTVENREQETARRSAEADRICRTKSAEVGTFTFAVNGRDFGQPYHREKTIAISDVDVTVSAPGEPGRRIWFGDIYQMELGHTYVDGKQPALPAIRIHYTDNGQQSIEITDNVGRQAELSSTYGLLESAHRSWKQWRSAMVAGTAPLSPRTQNQASGSVVPSLDAVSTTKTWIRAWAGQDKESIQAMFAFPFYWNGLLLTVDEFWPSYTSKARSQSLGPLQADRMGVIDRKYATSETLQPLATWCPVGAAVVKAMFGEQESGFCVIDGHVLGFRDKK